MDHDELYDCISEWSALLDLELTPQQIHLLIDRVNDRLLSAELKTSYPMVTPLSSGSVTPSMIIRSIITQIDNLQEIYVVGIEPNGMPIMWLSGNMQGLAFASLVFQDTSLKKLNDNYRKSKEL